MTKDTPARIDPAVLRKRIRVQLCSTLASETGPHVRACRDASVDVGFWCDACVANEVLDQLDKAEAVRSALVQEVEKYLQHTKDCERVTGTRYIYSNDWGEQSYRRQVPGKCCTCGVDEFKSRLLTAGSTEGV